MEGEASVSTAAPERETDSRREQTRALALQAARALLAEEGWDAITHLRVAERAGLGRATIYRHWRDPGGLRRDALAEEIHVFHIVPTGDLRADLISELLAIRHELAERGQSRVFATLIGHAQGDAEVRRLKSELVEEGTAGLRRIVTDALADGRLGPGLDLEEAVALLAGPVSYKAFLADEPISVELLEQTVDGLLGLWAVKPRRR